MLEDGQYDHRWALIHMMPEETAQAADDLRAKAVLPAHSGKFAMANHGMNLFPGLQMPLVRKTGVC